MLFNSMQYAVFLPIVFAIYWALPHKYRWFLLLISSYYFYMSWNPKYVFLILMTTVISYLSAIALERWRGNTVRKAILAGSAVICLGTLFLFKYFNFFMSSFSKVCSAFSIHLHPMSLKLLLPVGISFYTFQTLSYVIDVYRGDIPAEHHFGKYATFISFFPQLVAGPIERASNLLPQILGEHTFDYDQASYGLKLMAWGFFKKILIADKLAQYTSILTSPQAYSGFSLALAVFLFAIQIYCDFSGYSDIAIGTAKLLGINLMTNFKSPYFSQSIHEFWSRWHISLSSWFRDYVYIPLGGNRVGKARHCLNLMITFLISGLWHGAQWTFVIWGAVHGAVQIAENLLLPKRLRKPSTGLVGFVRVVLVFAVCCFAWVFFVSDCTTDALFTLRHLFNGISNPIAYLNTGFLNLNIFPEKMPGIFAPIALLTVYDWYSMKKDVISAISAQQWYIRWAVYLMFTLWLIVMMPYNQTSEFIYFQF